MKLSIFITGKNNFEFISDGMKLYEERLKHFVVLNIRYFPEQKYTASTNTNQIKEKESTVIMKAIDSSDYVVLLDEKGKEYSSKSFATFIDKKQQAGSKHLVFVIGGAYGFSDELYKRANEMLSLSKMTFTHQMVRLFFLEQLYRAFTIIKGIPYHHDWL